MTSRIRSMVFLFCGFLRQTDALRTVIIVALAPLFFSPAFAEDAWRLEKMSHGIKVYSRAVADSPIRAVRGVVKINAALDDALSLLQNIDARLSWDEMCVETYLVDTPAPGIEKIYLHHDLPWPVKDRDMILQTEWKIDTNTGVAHMYGKAVISGVSEYRDRVRVVNAENQWIITPLADGGLELQAVMHADPAGPIPAWVLNWLSVDAPITTLQKIKMILEQPASHNS